MTDAQQEELIKRVFRELQDSGLVRPTHRLRRFKNDGPDRYPEFHAGTYHFRTIYYGFGNCSFDADSLRFILLHEERHLRGMRDWFAYLFNVIGWTSLFIYLALFRNLQPPWSSLAVLIVPATWYGSMPFLRIGETRSDLWAARHMKAEFGIARPSEVALKAMTFPPREMSRAQRVLRNILFDALHADYHPPLKKRIERIAREVDNDP